MAKINVCDVEILDNPATYFDKFKFKITFECHEPLGEDLEWKIVYVGSAYNSSLDQTLDSILVGPIPVGRHQFVFEVNPPDPKKILTEDLIGVTVVLIQGHYRNQEFLRIGYYVNNEYKTEELRNEPPAEPNLNEVQRTIVAEDPRVTRFPIDWGDGLLDGCVEPEQKEEDVPESEIIKDDENDKEVETGASGDVPAADGEEEDEDDLEDVEEDEEEKDPAAEEDIGEETEDDEEDDEEEEEEDDEEGGEDEECEGDNEATAEAEPVHDENSGTVAMDTEPVPQKDAAAEPMPRQSTSPLKQI